MNIQTNLRGVAFVMCLTFFFIASGCVSSSSPSSNVSVSEPTKTKTPIPSRTPSISNHPARMQEVDYRCSNTTGINIRSGPGLNYDVVGWLLEGECVVVIETSLDGGWAKTDQGWLGTYYLVSSNGPISTQQIPTTQSTPTKTPIPTRTVSPTRIPTSIPTTKPIPTEAIMQCWQAYKYVGSWQTCKIIRAYCVFRPDVNEDPTFCNDAPYPNHDFTLVVWGQNWSDYDGKCLIVSGYISMFEGKPQIVAESRSQVSSCR